LHRLNKDWWISEQAKSGNIYSQSGFWFLVRSSTGVILSISTGKRM
jgi:hypothetical protein